MRLAVEVASVSVLEGWLSLTVLEDRTQLILTLVEWLVNLLLRLGHVECPYRGLICNCGGCPVQLALLSESTLTFSAHWHVLTHLSCIVGGHPMKFSPCYKSYDDLTAALKTHFEPKPSTRRLVEHGTRALEALG